MIQNNYLFIVKFASLENENENGKTRQVKNIFGVWTILVAMATCFYFSVFKWSIV